MQVKVLICILALLVCVSSTFSKKVKKDGVPGGYFEVDLNNQSGDFKEIDQYARNNFHDSCHSVNSSVNLLQLLRAYQQVVAGMNYQLVYKAEGHTKSTITIQVYEALPDENKNRAVSINSCA